jgi:L-lactate dehydrogenase
MKVSIVGIEHVGSSVGLAVVAQGLADEIVLVGRRPGVAVGEALDLLHASAFTTRPADVRAGGVGDTAGSDVVVLCAAAGGLGDTTGAGRRGADPRHGAIATNAALFRELVPPLVAASPDAVAVVTTNPLDAMTTLTLRVSGLPPARVIGTGTLLDTMRLRVLLSQHCGIHPMDIRAYVLGEHGDTQFAALSSASSGGAKLPVPPALLRRMVAQTHQAGFEICQGKGYTNHGVAMSAAAVVRAVGQDTCEVMPICTLVDGMYRVRDVCLSVPAVVGRGGVHHVLKVGLTAAERAAFRRSAEAVHRALAAADPDRTGAPP